MSRMLFSLGSCKDLTSFSKSLLQAKMPKVSTSNQICRSAPSDVRLARLELLELLLRLVRLERLLRLVRRAHGESGTGTGEGGKGGKGANLSAFWSSRTPIKKQFSFKWFWKRACKSSTFTWFWSESNISTFMACTGASEVANCWEMRSWSSWAKNCKRDFPSNFPVVPHNNKPLSCNESSMKFNDSSTCATAS